MAEINEGSLSDQLEECQLQDDGKKKKRCRVKPGRHKKEKQRVEQRERMIVEKEAKRDAEREEMAKIDRGLWPLGPSKISKAGLMPRTGP